MPSKKTFEENLQDLEAIVTKLENGDVVLKRILGSDRLSVCPLYIYIIRLLCKNVKSYFIFYCALTVSFTAPIP